MTSSSWLLAISCFSNYLALGSDLHGAQLMDRVYSSDNPISYWADLILPMWPFRTDSNSDYIITDLACNFSNHLIFIPRFADYFCHVFGAAHVSALLYVCLSFTRRSYYMALIAFSSAINFVVSFSKSLFELLVSFLFSNYVPWSCASVVVYLDCLSKSNFSCAEDLALPLIGAECIPEL